MDYFHPANTFFWVNFWMLHPHGSAQRALAQKNGLTNQALTKKGKSYWLKVGKEKVINVTKAIYDKVHVGDKVILKDLHTLQVNGHTYTLDAQ
ncbi:hypothetical protein GPK34_00470 [Secundilactobacillus kimchicus]|nr:hypothetical protein [Secundilactobacillus kimchicus]